MILRCKHCLDLLVSLLSLVLPNARSPLRTNFSFVFRQEMKLPNVFCYLASQSQDNNNNKKNGCPHMHGFSFEQVGHQNTRLTQWVHYSVLPKIPQKSFVWEKKNPFIWKQKAPQHSTITVGTQAERRATLWILLDYVRKGLAGGNLLVINDGPENGI